MVLTDSQRKALEPSVELYFRKAVESGYCPYPAPIHLNAMIRVFHEVSPKTPFNAGCSQCVISMVKKLGQWYFNDLKEMGR